VTFLYCKTRNHNPTSEVLSFILAGNYFSMQVHSKREMERVLGLSGVELIGINNRSLETFKVDINNTVDLLKGETGQTIHERGIVVVGESGLFTPEDIALVQAAGVGAVSSLHFICSGILWPQIHVNKIHFNPKIHFKNHRPNHEVF
jgi:hypothetical protein